MKFKVKALFLFISGHGLVNYGQRRGIFYNDQCQCELIHIRKFY